MPQDRTYSGTPAAEMPEATRRVHPLLPSENPLAVDLVPVVDDIRQLMTDFGLAPYRVHLVHLAYPGPRLGDGVPQVISSREILPTPRITDMSSTSEVLRATGLTEEGTIRVDRISAKFTEDDLLGKTPDMQDPAAPRTNSRNTAFYWEVTERRPSQPPSVPRRYVPSSVPTLSRGGFEWRVNLTKQEFDRSRYLSTDPTARKLQP